MPSHEPAFRRATRADVLGAKRERYTLPLPQRYDSAFEAIDTAPNNDLVVAELDGKVVGVCS